MWIVVILIAGLISGRSIFKVSNLDQYYFNTASGYLESSPLSKISYNKFTFYLNRYLDNFFVGVDPSYFFFGGHPRETPGGSNRMTVSYWLIPFFILSVYEQMEKKEWRVMALYGLTLAVVSLFSVEALWRLLVPFWYGVVIYPFRKLWGGSKPLPSLPLRKGEEKTMP